MAGRYKILMKCPTCPNLFGVVELRRHLPRCEGRIPHDQCACGRFKPRAAPSCCRCNGASAEIDALIQKGRMESVGAVGKSQTCPEKVGRRDWFPLRQRGPATGIVVVG